MNTEEVRKPAGWIVAIGSVKIDNFNQLPPVHPRCRIASFEAISAYTEKLRLAKNLQAIVQLHGAMEIFAAKWLTAKPELGRN